MKRVIEIFIDELEREIRAGSSWHQAVHTARLVTYVGTRAKHRWLLPRHLRDEERVRARSAGVDAVNKAINQ